MKATNILAAALLCGFFTITVQAAAFDVKYAAIQKEGDQWKVLSVTDDMPAYQDGIEILALPGFSPRFDKRFDMTESPYGGIDCPSVPDKTMYTPCNSYFYRFNGANWFGLGGIRVKPVQARIAEVKKAILADETVAAIQAKEDAEAAAWAKSKRDAELAQKARDMDEAIARRKAEDLERAANKERMISAPKGTKDFCGGIFLDGNPADPRKASALSFNCTKYGGQQYSDMVAAGWVIINVMTHPVNQFGRQALMYDISVEKQ